MSITESNTLHGGNKAKHKVKYNGKKIKHVNAGDIGRKRAGRNGRSNTNRCTGCLLAQIIAGLKEEICPAEVIIKEGDDFNFC